MSKPKGTPKTGGRTKGTENKITHSLREKFEKFTNAEFADIEKDIADIKKSDWYKNLKQEEKLNFALLRLNVITKMAGFVIPKKQEINLDENKIKNIADSSDKLNALFN